MAEVIATVLEVGPFKKEQSAKVNEILEELGGDFEPVFDPDRSSSEDGEYLTLDLGGVNYGVWGLTEPAPGRIDPLIRAGIPYILHDFGKDGVGSGTDASWHPNYGDEVKFRQRDTEGRLVLSEEAIGRIGPSSNEELGQAVRGYFATPGSPVATAGWDVWKYDYERQVEKRQRLIDSSGGGEDRKITDELRQEVVDAVEADEPAVHLVGSIGRGFAAYGPYASASEALDRHEPQIEQILEVVDLTMRDDDRLSAGDIDADHFGAVWVTGNLADGYWARGIYRTIEAAIEGNDGKDGFVLALTGPLR